MTTTNTVTFACIYFAFTLHGFAGTTLDPADADYSSAAPIPGGQRGFNSTRGIPASVVNDAELGDCIAFPCKTGSCTEDVVAYPDPAIYNNGEAKAECPLSCSMKGWEWDGNWRTTMYEAESVCNCKIPGCKPPTPMPVRPPPVPPMPVRLPTEKPSWRRWPTPEPVAPTPNPVPQPTAEPTPIPSADPTPSPSADPTPRPSAEPTPSPSAEATKKPSADPTPKPSSDASKKPAAEPTPNPSAGPTPAPNTASPTSTDAPTTAPPTHVPTTVSPTQRPTTDAPTTASPTSKPTTCKPTKKPTHAPTQLFKCYTWTDADLKMDMPEEERCMTAGFGFLYTRGDERLAPGCGDCHCCQPVHPPALQFKCYHYTSQDWEDKEHFGWTEEDLCIQYTGWGHVFANGDMSVAPGCGRCDCCVPDVPTPAKYECYHYTDDDMAYQKRLGLSDARMCLTAGLGFGHQIFPHPDELLPVDDLPYPGCDFPCECCQPATGTLAGAQSAGTDSGHLLAPPPSGSMDIGLVEAPISGTLDEHSFTCYHYTEADLAMTNLPESERCLTAGWGFVYTGGDASLAPGCGRCSCCQPVNKVETPSDRCFSCYHYTSADWALVDTGIMSERAMCETRGQGFLYTEGNDSIAPGCDRCWCCQPVPIVSPIDQLYCEIVA